MPDFVPILVEPKFDGNIGAVARSMKNFSLTHLIVVTKNPIGDEARQRAMHGLDILQKAKVVQSLDEALKSVDLAVGTSGIVGGEKNFYRTPLTPEEFANKICKYTGRVGLLFGREDFGLFTEELEKCDMLVTIPCNKKYHILNLSHAATIVFYELWKIGLKTSKRKMPTNKEKEVMHEFFSRLLDEIQFPQHKKAHTKVMFRRLMGRALPSKWEFYNMVGVFSRSVKTLRRRKKCSRDE